MTNANIETTYQGSESLFMGFLMIVLNPKNLEPSIKYKEKATKVLLNICTIILFTISISSSLLKRIELDDICR